MNISVEDIKKLRVKTSAGMALCKEALIKAEGDMEKAVDYINDRSDVISRLHNSTGAKIGLCKVAFNDAEKDFEKAVEIIKERGWENDLSQDEDRNKQGIIGVYVHGTDKKTVALAEVECLTDFVAKNENFEDFAYNVAMQVAAMKPEYVSEENVPEEKIKELKEIFRKEAEAEDKPEKIMDKIVEGKLAKYYQEKCLMNQKWFKDDSKTMKNLLDEASVSLGEQLQVNRILCWTM